METIKINNLNNIQMTEVIEFLNSKNIQHSIIKQKDPIPSGYILIRDWLKDEYNKKVMANIFMNVDSNNYIRHHLETIVKYAKTIKIVHKINGLYYINTQQTNIHDFAKSCKTKLTELGWRMSNEH